MNYFSVKSKEKAYDSILGFFFKSSGPYYIIYLMMFFVFSLNVIPRNIPIIMACLVFLVAPLEITSYLYIFSLPWMYVSYIFGGLTLSLVQSIIFIIKIALFKKRIKMSLFDIIMTFFLAFCGAVHLITYHSFTGISFVFYFFIACFFHSQICNDYKEKSLFLKNALFAILCSDFVAIVYGFFNNTNVNRWIRGLGYTAQLYGTMGTTRFGMYLCIALLFPLFFIEEKRIKIILSAILSICVLLTVSMTSILILLFIYLYYFFFFQKPGLRSIKILIYLIAIIALVVIFWNSISEISFVKPIVYRFNYVVDQYNMGNINAATTGRVDLGNTYLKRFESASFFEKMFGSSNISVEGEKFSHNSFIDMLNYFGIIGIALTLFLQVKRLSIYFKTQYFKHILLLKIIILVSAISVSIFSAQFWQIWLFI